MATEVTELTAALKALLSRYEPQSEDLKELVDALEDLTGRYKALEEKHAALQVENTSQAVRVASAEATTKAVSEQLADLRQANAGLTTEAKAARAAESKALERAGAVSGECAALKETVAALKTMTADLSEAVREAAAAHAPVGYTFTLDGRGRIKGAMPKVGS